MPGKDGRGPAGRGPMSGGGNGFCVIELGEDDLPGAQGGGKTSSQLLRRQNEKEENKMPAGDGTGPNGMGSMTGRGAGFCAGYSAPGYSNVMPGRGFGFNRGGAGYGRGMGRGMGFGRLAGFGRGRGYRGVPPAAPTRDQELEMLRSQADAMQGTLKEVQGRIQELEVSE